MNSKSGSEIKFGDCVVFKDSAGNFHGGRIIQTSMDASIVHIHSGVKVIAAKSSECHSVSELWEAYEAAHPPSAGESDELKQDGPTFEEFTAKGYAPEGYPPTGYAEKPSDGLVEYRSKNPATAKPSKSKRSK